MWHVTCDMWHVTHDAWHVGGVLTFSQNFSSPALPVCDYDIMKIWRKRPLTKSVNDEAVFRTAPATPGLLIRQYSLKSESERKVSNNVFRNSVAKYEMSWFTHFLRQYFGEQSCHKAILDFVQLLDSWYKLRVKAKQGLAKGQ